MNNTLNKQYMIQDKNDLRLSTFNYIKNIDNKNFNQYDMDYLIKLNKKYSYPMFLTSSNKEEVNFTYEIYYELDSYRYDYLDELDELISEDFNYSYKDVTTIVILNLNKEEIRFDFNEMIDIIDFDFSDTGILEILSDKLPLHLWGNKYYINNGKIYKESYL